MNDNKPALDQKCGIPSNEQQAIIWTNDGFVYWRTYASLDQLSKPTAKVSDVLTHWGLKNKMTKTLQMIFRRKFPVSISYWNFLTEIFFLL